VNMRRHLVLALAFILAVAGACSSPPAEPTTLNVYAASSLQDVLQQLIDTYQGDHPDVRVVPAFDATSTLRTQIEEGAPANVFLAADTTNPQELHDAGLAGTPVTFTGNKVTLIVPNDNPGAIDDWTDLASTGVSIIAAGEEVPITKYAQQTVDNLAALPDAPAGYASAVDGAIATREDNVRAVLTKIELSEGDAAFVYATDAASSQDVTEIALPDQAAAEATYDGAVVGENPPAAAQDSLDWLLDDEAQAIFDSFGFITPPAT
jgi:molybdate transport system substrate-binding protein